MERFRLHSVFQVQVFWLRKKSSGTADRLVMSTKWKGIADGDVMIQTPHGAQRSGADPVFFLGGGALVSCSTSTSINHIVFFAEYQLH